MYKRTLSPGITNFRIDQAYKVALENGALGGKLLGAGDGGYFLFYVPTKNKLNFIKAIEKKKLFIEPFTFDNDGLRSWVTKNKI